jgi:hypothetical protein
MVDTLYTDDMDGMQKHEVLAYLGVGEYQISNKKTSTNVENLFWQTHKFIYDSGDSASDIVYCTTSSTPTREIKESTTNEDADAIVPVYGCESCPNPQILIFRYKVDNKVHKLRVEVCPGHVDLNVRLVVTSMKDGNLMFDAAKKVEGLDSPQKNSSFLGIYTVNSALGINGWGSVTWQPYSPSADWSDSVNRSNAELKAKSEVTYSFENDRDISDIAIDIAHYGSGSFKSLRKSSKGILLYGMRFNGTTYYVESYVTGEQKNLKLSDGNYLSFTCHYGAPASTSVIQ